MPAVPAGSYIVANKSPVIENENSGFEVRPDSSLYRSAGDEIEVSTTTNG